MGNGLVLTALTQQITCYLCRLTWLINREKANAAPLGCSEPNYHDAECSRAVLFIACFGRTVIGFGL